MHTSGVYYSAISEVLIHHNREKSSEQELRSLHLLLTGTVYVTSSASSPQWSLKTCRCVILPASIWWMNYRKMLVDTCKERLSDETRAVMGLGKEETPPPAPLPTLPHCLGLWGWPSTPPPFSLLIGNLMHSPSLPSLSEPHIWMWSRFPSENPTLLEEWTVLVLG